jgi:biopolymer transport protein ExbD
MARGRRKYAAEEADVNMTPMLDIVFILLIFFIVTATFVKEVGLNLTPPPPPSEDQPQDPVPVIYINVDADNFIYVNGRLTDIDAVRANIERLHAENPRSAVLVAAHPRSRSGIAIRIVDQAELAEVPVSLVPAAEEE